MVSDFSLLLNIPLFYKSKNHEREKNQAGLLEDTSDFFLTLHSSHINTHSAAGHLKVKKLYFYLASNTKKQKKKIQVDGTFKNEKIKVQSEEENRG